MSSYSSPPGRGPSSATPKLHKKSTVGFLNKRPSITNEERHTSEAAQHANEAAQHANDPILPPPPSTNILIWCCVIGCSIFAILVILTGLVVLIGYLAYHPEIPRFNVRGASLNTLLLDKDFFLSSDTTLFIEAHNPNSKILVSYHYIKFDLQFEKHTIASTMMEPFRQVPKNTTGFIVDMNALAVLMEAREGVEISLAIQKNSRVSFDLLGTIKAKSHFGGITSVKYWMHTMCHLEFSPPPIGNGSLLTHDCRSRR